MKKLGTTKFFSPFFQLFFGRQRTPLVHAEARLSYTNIGKMLELATPNLTFFTMPRTLHHLLSDTPSSARLAHIFGTHPCKSRSFCYIGIWLPGVFLVRHSWMKMKFEESRLLVCSARPIIYQYRENIGTRKHLGIKKRTTDLMKSVALRGLNRVLSQSAYS